MANIKSDSLSQLRPFFKSLDDLNVMGKIHQFPIIVDSCIVISDLIWLTKHRKKTKARTSLQETVHAGTIVLYAPFELEDEVYSSIQRISLNEGISIEDLNKSWHEFRKWIRFKKVETPTDEEIERAQDPKDLPFKKLQNMTGYPIYTNDSDISAMGGKVIRQKTIKNSRDYSRSAAVEYTLKACGILSIIFSLKTIYAIMNLVRRAPGWLYIGGVIALFLLYKQRSNKNIKSVSKKNTFSIKKVFSGLFASFFDEFNDSQKKAEESLDLIKQEIHN